MGTAATLAASLGYKVGGPADGCHMINTDFVHGLFVYPWDSDATMSGFNIAGCAIYGTCQDCDIRPHNEWLSSEAKRIAVYVEDCNAEIAEEDLWTHITCPENHKKSYAGESNGVDNLGVSCT